MSDQIAPHGVTARWTQTELHVVETSQPVAVSGGPRVPPLAFEYPWPPVAPWVHLSKGGSLRGRLDRGEGLLKLDLELIALSSLGPVGALTLVDRFAESMPIECVSQAVASPKLGEAHPALHWAPQSRLNIGIVVRDERLKHCDTLWLSAAISGQQQMMGLLRLGY